MPELTLFVHEFLSCLAVVTDTQVAHGQLPTVKVVDLGFDCFIGIRRSGCCNTIGGICLLWNSIFVTVMILDISPTFIDVIIRMV